MLGDLRQYEIGSATHYSLPGASEFKVIAHRVMHPPELPELKLGDGDLFGASLSAPAFTSDLSTWNVTVHKHGLLTQTVALAQPPTFDKHLAVLRQHVPTDQMEALKRIVADEDLSTFGSFPEICMTDQEQTRIMIGLHGKTIVIDAYGPHAVAAMGDTEAEKTKAKRYCRLWDAIVDLTPLKPYLD